MLTFNCKTAFEACGCRRKVSPRCRSISVSLSIPLPPPSSMFSAEKRNDRESFIYSVLNLIESDFVREKFRSQQLGVPRVEKFRTTLTHLCVRLIFPLIVLFLFFFFFSFFTRQRHDVLFRVHSVILCPPSTSISLAEGEEIEFKLLNVAGTFG